jgi:hypothetical protein
MLLLILLTIPCVSASRGNVIRSCRLAIRVRLRSPTAVQASAKGASYGSASADGQNDGFPSSVTATSFSRSSWCSFYRGRPQAATYSSTTNGATAVIELTDRDTPGPRDAGCTCAGAGIYGANSRQLAAYNDLMAPLTDSASTSQDAVFKGRLQLISNLVPFHYQFLLVLCC